MSNKQVNIIIIDSHKIVREGIKAILESNPAYHVVGDSGRAEQMLELCAQKAIDLVIIDPQCPDFSSAEQIKEINTQHPSTKILVLSELADRDFIQEMVNSDIAGYLSKSSGKRELFKAIDRILRGENYYSNELTQKIVKDYVKSHAGRKHSGDPDSLTEREIEVLCFICREHTNQEIADELSISVRTVDSHRRNLLQKTGARNTAGLVRFAMEHKLFRA